jgi:hypothetical protein
MTKGRLVGKQYLLDVEEAHEAQQSVEKAARAKAVRDRFRRIRHNGGHLLLPQPRRREHRRRDGWGGIVLLRSLQETHIFDVLLHRTMPFQQNARPPRVVRRRVPARKNDPENVGVAVDVAPADQLADERKPRRVVRAVAVECGWFQPHQAQRADEEADSERRAPRRGIHHVNQLHGDDEALVHARRVLQ